MEINAQKIL